MAQVTFRGNPVTLAGSDLEGVVTRRHRLGIRE